MARRRVEVGIISGPLLAIGLLSAVTNGAQTKEWIRGVADIGTEIVCIPDAIFGDMVNLTACDSRDPIAELDSGSPTGAAD